MRNGIAAIVFNPPGSAALAAGLLLIGLLASAPTPHAAELNFRYQSWSVGASTTGRKDRLRGLPQISARALTKGPDGLLWVGTENGIARFDGLVFDVFNSRNTPALTSSWIDALFLDDAERVWVSTSDGVLLFEDGQFRRISSADDGFRINHMVQGNGGTIWLGGARLWNYAGGGMEAVSFHDGPVLGLLSVDDALWLLDDENRIQVFIDGQSPPSEQLMWPDLKVKKLDAWRGAVYGTTDRGLLQIVREAEMWRGTLIPAPDNQTIVATAASDNDLFAVSSDGSLHRLEQGQLRQVRTPSKLPLDLNPIATLAESDSSLWVGTTSSGLHNFWSGGAEREAEGTALASALSWSFFADDNVYVTTDEGLYRRINATRWELVVTAREIGNAIAYSYWQGAYGQFLGTRTGLYWRENTQSTFVKQAQLDSRQINSIVEKDGGLWVTTDRGLFDFDPVTGGYSAVDGFQERAVRAVATDSEGVLWVATEGGLARVDGRGLANSGDDLLDSAFTTALLEFDENWLAVATYGEGLFIRSPEQAWHHFDIDNGLAFQDFFSLTRDGEWLWVSAGSGVMRFKIDALKQGIGTADVILRDDGLYPGRNRLRCCNGAGHRRSVMADGRLFLPTLEGVLAVPLDQPPQRASRPAITAVWQGDRRLFFRGPLTLDKSQRDIQISFASAHFAGENLPEFRYRLLPSNKEWVYLAGRKTAYFTNLDPGSATFELQARVGVSDWLSADPLDIEVEPYFYETWTARVLFLIAVLGLFWLLLKYRTDQLRNQATELEALIAARTADARHAKQAMEETLRDGLRVIHQANAPIITIASNGIVLDWNRSAEKVSGYSAREVIGENLTTLLTDASPPIDIANIFRLLREGQRMDSERLSFRNRSGRRVTLLIGGTLLPAAGDFPERIVIVAQDLTAYLEREQQLIQASKMSTLGEMATGMAHELNQPLNIIKLTLTNIIRTIETKPESVNVIPGKLRRISLQVDRAAKIIDHLRLYGRRSGTPGSDEHILFDPQVAVSDAVSMFREQLNLESIELELITLDDDYLVDGDPLLLEQVIMNLLGNARDAIKQHVSETGARQIQVRTSTRKDYFVLEVEDTGGGASDDAIKNMFEPFFTTKDPGKGTGLGLSISYGAIQNMSGRISAQNGSSGLVVRIELPMADLSDAEQGRIEVAGEQSD